MALDVGDVDADFAELDALIGPLADDGPSPAAEPKAKVKWERRQPNLLAYARECRARQLVQGRLEDAQEKLARLSARCFAGLRWRHPERNRGAWHPFDIFCFDNSRPHQSHADT